MKWHVGVLVAVLLSALLLFSRKKPDGKVPVVVPAAAFSRDSFKVETIPSLDRIVIRYYSEVTSNARISIYAVNGQFLNEKLVPVVTGWNRWEYEMKHHPAGIFLVSFYIKGRTHTAKVSIGSSRVPDGSGK